MAEGSGNVVRIPVLPGCMISGIEVLDTRAAREREGDPRATITPAIRLLEVVIVPFDPCLGDKARHVQGKNIEYLVNCHGRPA